MKDAFPYWMYRNSKRVYTGRSFIIQISGKLLRWKSLSVLRGGDDSGFYQSVEREITVSALKMCSMLRDFASIWCVGSWMSPR